MIVGLIAFCLYLYFFVGFGELFFVLINLNPIDYATFYTLAMEGTLLSFLFLSAAWQILLKAVSIRTKLKNLFLYTWVGTLVDLIVPCQAVCGEVTRIYLVQKDEGGNYGAIAAASITNRIISYTISSFGLLTGIVLLLSRSVANPPMLLNLLVVALIGTVIYLLILVYIAINEKAPKKLTTVAFKVLMLLRLKRLMPEDLSMKAEDVLNIFHRGFQIFRKNPKHIVKPVVFQLLSLLLSISVYFLVFYSIGYTIIHIDFFIIAYFIVGTVQIAAAVFSVGTLEIVLTNLFVLYGVPIGLSGLAATLLRVLTFWMPIIVGYVIVQVVGARSLLNPKTREKLETRQNTKKVL